MKSEGNTILITGGGSGIGAELARRFHDLGNTVIVAGRRAQALAQVAEGRAGIHAQTLDIENAGAIAAFARELTTRFPALNVLINNAGVMRFEQIGGGRDLADAEATVTTNLLGPIRLTNALVDHLAAQPDAAIVNVTSGLAFVPLTLAATYCATKAAMHSYTVSLREELGGRIEVIELAPPGVRTTLTPGQEDREQYQPLGEFIEQTMAQFTSVPTPPEIVIQRAVGLRTAEAEHRFDATLKQLNEFARQARENA